MFQLPTGESHSSASYFGIHQIVTPWIQVEQCGFHRTVEELYTLSRVMEGAWEFAKLVYMCFVNMEKVLNCGCQEVLWAVL